MKSQHSRQFQGGFDVLAKKASSYSDLLRDPSIIKKHPQKFIALYKNIFNDKLNIKNMSLDECMQWLEFSKQALYFAPDLSTTRMAGAMCMRLYWIAALKTQGDEKETFVEKSISYANKIFSPVGLNPSDNYLLFELYRMQSKGCVDSKGLMFLHEAVWDMQASSEKNVDESMVMLLTATVNSILNIKSIDPNKTSWTEQDENNYQKAFYILRVKEYVATIEKLAIEMVSLHSKESERLTDGLYDRVYSGLTNVKKALSTNNIEEIRSELDVFKSRCLPAAKKIIKHTSKEKNIIFLKNLAVCILTIPLLGAGLVLAAKWASHHAKTKEHLLFNPHKIQKEKNKQKTFRKAIESISTVKK